MKTGLAVLILLLVPRSLQDVQPPAVAIDDFYQFTWDCAVCIGDSKCFECPEYPIDPVRKPAVSWWMRFIGDYTWK